MNTIDIAIRILCPESHRNAVGGDRMVIVPAPDASGGSE